MIRRSAIVSIAITLGQLVAGQRSGWTDDQELVLDALRRSTTRLNDATDQELADYLLGRRLRRHGLLHHLQLQLG